MTAVAQRIEKEIQQLSLEEMLALHEKLLVSIGEKENAERLDPAYVDELQRRIREIDSGKVEGVDAFRALDEM